MLNTETGQGTTAKVYRNLNIATKYYLNTSLVQVKSEADFQKFAYNSGLSVPIVYGVRELDEKNIAFDMEYIHGQAIIKKGMDKDERRNAIYTLARLQCDIHKITAFELPKQSERLINRIKTSLYMNEYKKKELLLLNEKLGKDCNNLCHGDLHPNNILYDGRKLWIIDWADATAGNPLADACRTYLILKQYMSRSSGIYLNIFCKMTNYRLEEVLAWLPIIAAARMCENIDLSTRLWLSNYL